MTAESARDAARTRHRLITAARHHFAAQGYDRVTLRAIAADAQVSPNLITRYFGGKRGLFDAATHVDLGVTEALPGPRRTLGRRIARHVVTRWEDHASDDPLLTMLRAATTDEAGADRLAEFFRHQAITPLTEHLDRPDAPERAAAVSALIMGTVLQRYVLRAGPTADAHRDQIEDWLGDALQRLLTGSPFTPLHARRPTNDLHTRHLDGPIASRRS